MLFMIFIVALLPAALCRYVTSDRILTQEVLNSKSSPFRRQRSEQIPRALIPSLKIRNGPPEIVEVSFADSTTLECEAGGNPPPTIHWLKDGRRIPQSVYEAVLPESSAENTMPPLGLSFTRSRLFLDCIDPREAGVYSCVAENAFHRASQSTVLTVADAPQMEHSAICLAKKSFGSPARIHMWTHNRLELIGNDVQLFCRSAGEPQPKVQWIGPDEIPITDSEKYQVLDNGDLVIRNIEWSDMGDYTCEVKNSHGSDSTSTFLYPTQPGKRKATTA